MNEKNENDNSENESSIAVEAEEATHENNHIDVVENAAEVENIENSEKTCEAHVQRDNIEVKNDDEVIENTVSHQTSTANATPDVIPVYCIATIENCPDSELNKDYGDSIRQFLASEQHLAQNIISLRS